MTRRHESFRNRRSCYGVADEYLASLSFGPRLTPMEEAQLAWRVHKDHDEEARRLLVERNMPLVVEIAKDYQRPDLPIADLVSEGALALIHAVDGHDPERWHFGAYAGIWIRRAMQRIAPRNRSVHLSMRGDAMYRRVAPYLAQCEKHGEEPSLDRLRELAFGQTSQLTATQRVNQNQTLRALQRRYQERQSTLNDDGIGAPTTGSRTETFSTNLERQEIHDVIRATIDALDAPTRDREILKYRLGVYGGEPWSRQDTGREFGVSHEWVRQIEVKYLGEIRQFVADRLGMEVTTILR